MTRIEIDVDDPQTLALWIALGNLAARLPGEWVLVGGLMVQLHALERGGSDVRVTADIDVLGQARPQGALDAIDKALHAEGFELVGPDVDGFAYRYRRGALTIDVLSPEGIRPPRRSVDKRPSASPAVRRRSNGPKWSQCRSTVVTSSSGGRPCWGRSSSRPGR
jgi:hypothetical protein